MHKIGIACLGLFILLGCLRPNRVENGLTDAVAAWRDAVLHNRPRQAYELLDDETRQKFPYARFEREWKNNRAEMLSEAHRMKPENARMMAVIHLGKTDSATLVSIRRGVWKVEDAPGLRPSTPSPDALLRGMAGALKRRDWPLYLSLLTPEYRHAVEEDINQKIITFEKAAENLPSAGTSTVLRVPLDSAGVMVLVLRRVNGSWRVDGFETARGGKPK